MEVTIRHNWKGIKDTEMDIVDLIDDGLTKKAKSISDFGKMELLEERIDTLQRFVANLVDILAESKSIEINVLKEILDNIILDLNHEIIIK